MRTANAVRYGLLFRWGSFWVGFHWSSHNRRICINLLPCVTVWVTLAGGIAPTAIQGGRVPT